MKLVVFDVDGTLIDSQHMIVSSMNAGMDAAGLPHLPREAILSIVGLSLPVAVATVLGAGIAALVRWRRWSGWAAAALLVGAILVVGVPVAPLEQSQSSEEDRHRQWREVGIGAQILVDLGVRKMRLMTNNPTKIVGLEGYGLEVTKREPLELDACSFNADYLRTKKEKMGHLLQLGENEEKGVPAQACGCGGAACSTPSDAKKRS